MSKLKLIALVLVVAVIAVIGLPMLPKDSGEQPSDTVPEPPVVEPAEEPAEPEQPSRYDELPPIISKRQPEDDRHPPVLRSIKGDDPFTLDPYGHGRDKLLKATETCWPSITVNINNAGAARLQEVVILIRQFD